jgi:hypothetical protein
MRGRRTARRCFHCMSVARGGGRGRGAPVAMAPAGDAGSWLDSAPGDCSLPRHGDGNRPGKALPLPAQIRSAVPETWRPVSRRASSLRFSPARRSARRRTHRAKTDRPSPANCRVTIALIPWPSGQSHTCTSATVSTVRYDWRKFRGLYRSGRATIALKRGPDSSPFPCIHTFENVLCCIFRHVEDVHGSGYRPGGTGPGTAAGECSADDPVGGGGVGEVAVDGEHVWVLGRLHCAGGSYHAPALPAVGRDQAGADALGAAGDDGDLLALSLMAFPSAPWPAGT